MTAAVIVHVAESFGGGVAAAVRDYVRNTPYYEHRLLYANRDDAPITPADLEGFEEVSSLPEGHLRRVSAIRQYLKEFPDAIIHAHSSFGGVYARLAVSSRRRHVVYTPHCYAFERTDLSLLKRSAYKFVEWALSLNTSVFAVCSPREASLSEWRLNKKSAIVFVPNVPPEGAVTKARAVQSGRPLEVVGGGRLGKQKDPRYFLEVLAAIRSSGTPVASTWIGGGAAEDVALLHRNGVRVLGWLERKRAMEQLTRADLYVHSAAWEGFPVAVLEAVALGVPVVARRIPAFDGVALPILIDTPEDVVSHLPVLVEPEGRSWLAQEAREALVDHTDSRQAAALMRAYKPDAKWTDALNHARAREPSSAGLS